MASRGVMNDLMKRLMTTYKATGGNKFDEEAEDTSGLSPFDGAKLLLVKKIQSTRKKVQERDELMSKKKSNNNKTIRLNNEIRQMIKILKQDHNKLVEIQQKNAKKKMAFFMSKKKGPERESLILRQQEDCELIFKHIVEVEELDKRRNKSRSVDREKDRSKDSLLDGGGADDEFGSSPSVGAGGSDGGGPGGARRLMLQTELPDDATQSNLPEIDISDALQKVDSYKQKIDQGLDILSLKLDNLKQISVTMGDELDEQSIMLDELDKKVDKTNIVLEKLNKRLTGAQDAVNNTTIWIIIIIMIIVVIVLCVVGYILFNQFIQPALPRVRINN